MGSQFEEISIHSKLKVLLFLRVISLIAENRTLITIS
jgi:hypothetical protein